MSDDRDLRDPVTDTPDVASPPVDRLDRVAGGADGGEAPAVYGVATPGGGRRAFLQTVTQGVLASSVALTGPCSSKSGGGGGSPAAPTPTTATMSGTVTDQANGTAISGATVEAADGPNAGRSATSGSSGGYTLTGLTTGGFTARASASGYVSASRGVTLTGDRTENFALQKVVVNQTFTMHGVVSNRTTGRGILGAQVRVLDGPNANKTGACDGNGYYSITGLVRGGFTARVTATGYTNMERGIGIQADTRQDFALASSTPAPCTCNPHCTCNPVCTCNPHCTCNSQHYWYPN